MMTQINQQRPKKILVVDDDPDICELLEYNLKAAGYAVQTASDGMRALWRVCDDNPPDCILLDLMMPSPDGYELCAYLKQSEEYQQIPVVIISALGMPIDIERGLSLGANAYLKKSSFTMADLRATIERLTGAADTISGAH